GEPRFREAACFAHWRRDFHDIWKSQRSPIAHEALERIGQLYDIERDIAGKPADVRRAVRQELSRPRLEALHAWAQMQLTRIPAKGDLAKAFRYALARWHAFSLFLDDGRVAIDNNAAERAVRPICLGKKNSYDHCQRLSRNKTGRTRSDRGQPDRHRKRQRTGARAYSTVAHTLVRGLATPW